MDLSSLESQLDSSCGIQMVPTPAMENSTVSVPRSLFSIVPNKILVRLSSLGTQQWLSSHKDWITLLSGYNSLPSLLKREAHPRAVGMTEKQKQVIWVRGISIRIHMLCLSTLVLCILGFRSKGSSHCHPRLFLSDCEHTLS